MGWRLVRLFYHAEVEPQEASSDIGVFQKISGLYGVFVEAIERFFTYWFIVTSWNLRAGSKLKQTIGFSNTIIDLVVLIDTTSKSLLTVHGRASCR
jgi:hypothetical protein